MALVTALEMLEDTAFSLQVYDYQHKKIYSFNAHFSLSGYTFHVVGQIYPHLVSMQFSPKNK